MRKAFVITFFLAVSFSVFAQDKSSNTGSLRFGVNAAFYSKENVTGVNIYGEFAQPVASYLSVVPRVFGGVATDFKQTRYFNNESYQYFTSIGGSIAARYTPTQKILDRISVDAGIAYLNTISTYGIQRQKIEIDDIMTYSPGHIEISYYSEKYFAFTGSVCIEVIRTARINSGVRFDYLTSFSDDNWNKPDIKQAGLYFGVKL